MNKVIMLYGSLQGLRNKVKEFLIQKIEQSNDEEIKETIKEFLHKKLTPTDMCQLSFLLPMQMSDILSLKPTVNKKNVELIETIETILDDMETLCKEEEDNEINLMKNFEDAKQALYDHVGFVEDWVVYAIDDRTRYFWKIKNTSRDVGYSETIEELKSEEGEYFEDEIYTQRFYDKHVFRGEKYTMIFVDTHCDGNKFFAFFLNDKEIKNC